MKLSESAPSARIPPLKKIVIPSTVTEIKSLAFFDCHSLSDVTIPEGVKYISVCAFESCALTSVRIPASVVYLGTESFGYNHQSFGDIYDVPIEGFKIYGTKGSAAEKYALKRSFEFVQLLNEITISDLYVPRVGKTLTDEASAEGNFNVEYISWYNVTDEKWVENSYVVENNKQYEANIHIKADDGYEFTDIDSITAVVNDSPVSSIESIPEHDKGKYLNVSVTYTAFDNEIVKLNEVDVTGVVAPVDGEKAVKTASDGLYFKIYNLNWYDSDANKWMSDGDSFEAGKSYEANVIVRAVDGYEFAEPTDSVSATINGFTATAHKTEFKEPTEYLIIRYTFVCSAKGEEPTEEPTGTIEPSNPTESTEPEQPTETAEPSNPPETTAPVNPTEKTDPEQPTEKPTETTQPEKPTEPAEQPTEKPTEATEPEKPTEPEPTVEPEPQKWDISDWNVTGIKDKTYTGKEIKQSVKVKDSKGDAADFTVSYENNINVGTATMKITGVGEFTGSITKTFKIKKAGNPIKVSVKKQKVNLKKLKTKAQKVKALTVKGAKGKVSFKLVKKGITKAIRKLVKIDKKGVITVNKWKKAKKGAYKIKLTISAKGNSNFSKKTVTKTVTINIK